MNFLFYFRGKYIKVATATAHTKKRSRKKWKLKYFVRYTSRAKPSRKREKIQTIIHYEQVLLMLLGLLADSPRMGHWILLFYFRQQAWVSFSDFHRKKFVSRWEVFKLFNYALHLTLLSRIAEPWRLVFCAISTLFSLFARIFSFHLI